MLISAMMVMMGTSTAKQKPLGKRGRAMRIMPYPPSLSNTPASSTLPAVGASVCASGNQVWNEWDLDGESNEERL